MHRSDSASPWYGKRNRVIFLSTILCMLLGLVVLAIIMSLLPTSKRIDRTTTVRQVEVTQAYALQWVASSNASELRLSVPVADFGEWDQGRNPVIAETSDGPRSISLVIPVPDGDGKLDKMDAGCSGDELAAHTCALDRGRMRIDRDRPEGAHTEADAHVEVVWINEVEGMPVFLGFDCDGSLHCFRPAGLQWLFGGWFGLRKLKVEFADSNACERKFEFRGRPVEVDSRFPCGSPQSWLTFKNSIQLLRRMTQEAAMPPAPDNLRTRSLRALDTCQTLDSTLAALRHSNLRDATESTGWLCGYALQLLRVRLEFAPEEVAPQMVAVIGLQGYRETLWDRWYLEEVIQALQKAGKAASPTAFRAEGLRFRRLGWGYRAEEVEAAKQSLATLAARVPQLNSLDYDLFDTAERGLWSGVQPEGRRPQAGAFLRAWYDKSGALAPQSDAALKIRNIVCLHMALRGFDRALLKQCADALLSGWDQRITAGQPMGFEKKPWLATNLVRMYQGYGYETRDVPGALDGLRRIRQFAQLRLQDDLEIAPALVELTTAEKDLVEFSKKIGGGSKPVDSMAPSAFR